MKTRLVRFINFKSVGLLIFSIVLQKSTIACPVEDFLKHIGGLIFLVPITPSGKIVLARHADQETPCLIRFSKCQATRPIDFAWHAVCQMINSFQCHELKDFKVLRAKSRTPLGQPAYIYYLMFFLDDELDLKTKVQKFFTTPIEMQLISSGRSFDSKSIEVLILEQCFSPKEGIAITLDDRSWIVGSVSYNQRRQTIEISFAPPEKALDRLEISKRAEDGLRHISDRRVGDLATKIHPDKRGPITLAFAELEVLNLITPPLRSVDSVKVEQSKEDHDEEFPPTEHDSANEEEEYDDQIPYHKLDPEERLRITRERLLEKLKERRAAAKPLKESCDREEIARQITIADQAEQALIEEEFLQKFKQLFNKTKSGLKKLRKKSCQEEEIIQLLIHVQDLSRALEVEFRMLFAQVKAASLKFRDQKLAQEEKLLKEIHNFACELEIKKQIYLQDSKAAKDAKSKPDPLPKAARDPKRRMADKPAPKKPKSSLPARSSLGAMPEPHARPGPKPEPVERLLIPSVQRPEPPVCARKSEACPRAMPSVQTDFAAPKELAGPPTGAEDFLAGQEGEVAAEGPPVAMVVERPRPQSPECLNPEDDPVFIGELPRLGPISSPSRQAQGQNQGS